MFDTTIYKATRGSQVLVQRPVRIIESQIAQLFSEDKKEKEDMLTVRPLSFKEAMAVCMNPDSPFNNIIPGYAYIIYITNTINTGWKAARTIYHSLLTQGMTEEQVCSTIFVVLDDHKEYNLSAVKKIDL